MILMVIKKKNIKNFYLPWRHTSKCGKPLGKTWFFHIVWYLGEHQSVGEWMFIPQNMEMFHYIILYPHCVFNYIPKISPQDGERFYNSSIHPCLGTVFLIIPLALILDITSDMFLIHPQIPEAFGTSKSSGTFFRIFHEININKPGILQATPMKNSR